MVLKVGEMHPDCLTKRTVLKRGQIREVQLALIEPKAIDDLQTTH
jgi:hypothetical protein